MNTRCLALCSVVLTAGCTCSPAAKTPRPEVEATPTAAPATPPPSAPNAPTEPPDDARCRGLPEGVRPGMALSGMCGTMKPTYYFDGERCRELAAGSCLMGRFGTPVSALQFERLVACEAAYAHCRERRDEAAGLVIATYNTNFGLARDPSQLASVRSLRADVILIQEATDALRDVLVPLKATLPFQHWEPPAAPYAASGSAILSRYPVSEVVVASSPSGLFDALAAVVDAPGGRIGVAGVHLTPPGTLADLAGLDAKHLAEMKDHLTTLRRAHPDVSGRVIAGDFNEVRGSSLKMLATEDFTDAFEGYPSPPTWFWSVGPVRIGGIKALLARRAYRPRGNRSPVM